MIFIDFGLKSGQTTITVTCALKNQYENLPDWLGKYVGMKKRVGGYTIFLTLWVIMFFGDMPLRDDGADSRELIKEVYFAMKMQISLLSAWSPLWYSPGQRTNGPPPYVGNML